ncbi:hypothetical protein FXO38_35244 [Capsicum annuum]|nr:hypothetical protein FXO38_35244 [Capsicum annuum]KAF3615609.1 hypothetical protein FXO37_35434 [Capsicum annuum]
MTAVAAGEKSGRRLDTYRWDELRWFDGVIAGEGERRKLRPELADAPQPEQRLLAAEQQLALLSSPAAMGFWSVTATADLAVVLRRGSRRAKEGLTCGSFTGERGERSDTERDGGVGVDAVVVVVGSRVGRGGWAARWWGWWCCGSSRSSGRLPTSLRERE